MKKKLGIDAVLNEKRELLGVSVHWLCTGFLQEVKANGNDENSNIYQIEDLSSSRLGVIRSKGKKVKCPTDGRMGASYVDCLKGKKNVGPANAMLSYGWSNTVGDIIHTLVNHCISNGLNPKRTYFWICCLCNNQHRVVSKRNSEMDNNSDDEDKVENQFDEFHEIFKRTVTDINNVVALMSPWNEPIYLSRVWCIFELFTAHENGVQLTIAMPPKEREKLMEAVVAGNGVNAIYDALTKTCIEKSKASEDFDRQRILKLVQDGPGYSKLNIHVNNLLRQWVKDSISMGVAGAEKGSKDVKHDVEFANLSHNAANIMLENGEYEKALSFFHKGRIIREQAFGSLHEDTSKSYYKLGCAYQKVSQMFIALDYLHKALSIQKEVLGDHPATAETCSAIGSWHKTKGETKKELLFYEEALAMRERIYGVDNLNLDMADSYRNVGKLLENEMRYGDALLYYLKSVGIHERILGGSHPKTAELYCNVGIIYGKQKKYAQSVEYFEKAQAVQEKVLGRHPEAAESYHQMGVLAMQRGEEKKALEDLKMALSIRSEACGTAHPVTAESYFHLGRWYENSGDFTTSLKYLKKAKSIREKSFGLDHPKTVNTFELMRQVENKKRFGIHVSEMIRQVEDVNSFLGSKIHDMMISQCANQTSAFSFRNDTSEVIKNDYHLLDSHLI